MFKTVYGRAILWVRYSPVLSSVFVRITENLKELEEIGKRVYREGAKKVMIETYSQEDRSDFQ